jgi:glycosyltransferase involved in cell wall biosynthesis
MSQISVITVCKNVASDLERTIQSVLMQNFKDYEYIIIDGKSSDNTFKILKQYEKQITKIISESDTGIYDAMNKGISLAAGRYLLFLNAGDELLHENILNIAAERIDKNPVDIFFGHTLEVDKKTGLAYVRSQRPYLNNLILFRQTIAHQAAFISRRAFEKYGKYDNSLCVVADWEWFLRAVLRFKASYYYHDFVCTLFELGGLSWCSDPIVQRVHSLERQSVENRYFNVFQKSVYRREFIYWKLCRLSDLLYKLSKRKFFENFAH